MTLPMKAFDKFCFSQRIPVPLHAIVRAVRRYAPLMLDPDKHPTPTTQEEAQKWLREARVALTGKKLPQAVLVYLDDDALFSLLYTSELIRLLRACPKPMTTDRYWWRRK